MQSTQHRRPARAQASLPLQLAHQLGHGQVGLARDQRDQPLRDLASNRRRVTAAARPRSDGARLAMTAQDAANGRPTNAEQRRDLLVTEPPLVERPDDRFAQLRRSGHSNRRSHFADHLNWIAG